MSISNKITHYQEQIGRNKEKTETLIHCINKLHELPITVKHLEETRIGKTINKLRKFDGGVGNAAMALISKWKRMAFLEETITEEQDEKERDLKNIVVNNSEENVLNSVNIEKEHPTHTKKNTNSLSGTAGNDGTEMPPKIYEGHTNSTANINYNVSKSEGRRCDILHQSTEEDKNAHLAAENIGHVLPINESNSKTEKQKGSHHCRHRNKHHSRKRRDKPKHNRKYKGVDNELRIKKDSIKIKLEKVHTGDENKSISSGSSKHRHCSKRSENETKCLESKHCHKERGQKRKAGLNEIHNESILKRSKASEKSKEKIAFSVDYFAGALRMGGAMESKRQSSTTTSMLRNSDSNSSASIKTSIPFNTICGIIPTKPYLCLPDPKCQPLNKVVDLISILSKTHSSSYNPLQHLPLTQEAPTLKYDVTSKQHRYSTKVYSGVKTGQPVPTLYELCLHVLKKHIGASECTGGVPYGILKPILQQATAEQLLQVEYYNPYLLEDTSELWELHCRKEFHSGQFQPTETAREMYLRCLAEREAKLKAFTCNKPAPVPQTKLTFVDSDPKPPQNVARKQAKRRTRSIPKSKDGKSQRRSTLKKSTNPTARVKPQLAPLMQKTLKLAKRYRRQAGYF